MTQRLLHTDDYSTTVRFVNPTDTFDYIDITPLENGSLRIRSTGLGSGPLQITPEACNAIVVKVGGGRS